MDSNKKVSRLGGGDAGRRAYSRMLDSVSGSDFVLSVTRAQTEATDAGTEGVDDMVTWVKRLKPYFDFDPDMTVAQAVDLYLEDRSKKTLPNAKLAQSD